LDNAAKLFPSVTNGRNTSVFRVSFILREEVDPDILQQATDKIFTRFPMLTVRLRRGVFWNYFDANSGRLLVAREQLYPCANIDYKGNRGYLMRVLYFDHRVSIEVFHSLTDGGGAIEFAKSLLYYYLKFSGEAVEPGDQIILTDGGVKPYEHEDSFRSYYQRGLAAPAETHERAFRIAGSRFDRRGNNVLHGIVSAQALNALAKRQGCTITSYLVALLMFSIYQSRMRYGVFDAPIVVSVPVNLRKPFPSRTLRNFFGVVNIGLRMTSAITLDDLARQVHDDLRDKTEKDSLNAIINRYVSLERHPAARFVPLFLKHFFVGAGFDRGENSRTITLSNLGNIVLPPSLYEHISHFEAMNYPTRKAPIACAVCSVNDQLVITFSRAIAEKDIPQYFFSYLAESLGLDVTVYSNDWGKRDQV
jgi:NRPS condensation-like uncharacterized protein